MKVKATATGFFGGGLRKVGAEFTVKKEAFSEAWMEEVGKKKEPKAAKEPKEESEEGA